MAFAVLVVAVGYAMGRSREPYAQSFFWAGQLTLYLVPTVFLLMRRAVTRFEGAAVAVLVPSATYAVLECYQPIQFRFLDEFAHVQTAQSILTSHHLFLPNTVLPVSSQYPGLEIVTTAIASISHLSIYASGTIVAGLAHVLLGIGLYYLVVEIAANPRIGGLAVVLYATGPHFQFFDSYFLYEVIALPFLVGTLLATVKVSKATRSTTATGWSLVAILCALVTVVSHHVTSYALIGLLLCFVGAVLIHPGARRYPYHLLSIFAAAVGLTVLWDLGVATDTTAYILPQLHHALSILNPAKLFSTSKKTGGTYGSPSSDTIIEATGQVVLVVLVIFGIVQTLRQRASKNKALMLASAVASLTLFLEIVLRISLSNGSELAARLSSYALIPIALTVGAALSFGRSSPRHARSWLVIRVVAQLLAVAGFLALAAGGVAGGWPAYYARLPGPFLVGAWERSVDAHNLGLSEFLADKLPPGSGVVSDFVTAAMAAGLGRQEDVGGGASLFITRTLTSKDISLMERSKISLVIVDRRLAQNLPAAGYYFSPDPNSGHYKSPIPSASLSKFNKVRGISRIFDDGTVSVYDVRQVGQLQNLLPGELQPTASNQWLPSGAAGYSIGHGGVYEFGVIEGVDNNAYSAISTLQITEQDIARGTTVYFEPALGVFVQIKTLQQLQQIEGNSPQTTTYARVG